MRLSYAISILTCVTSSVLALSPAGWRAQSIYQVLTDRFARTDGSTTAACNTGDQVYCGGSWQGIINHLDYIQGMGFTAIWISPVVENLPQDTSDGEGYHGYWAQNIYSLNSNFGTAADLVALSVTLHARGMYLMVDVVTNHMGYAGCGTCVDYAVFNPFNSKSYYHPFCLIDYNNATSIKVCWEGDNTVSLPDLRTEDSGVLSMWETWIAQLVANYSIDGLRLDSAQQVDTAFFGPFQSAAGGIHILGEVFNGDPAYVCPYQNYLSGLLNYPAYYWITQAFQSTSGSISNLANGIKTMLNDCVDTTLLGSFIENHDVPRFPYYTSDISLAKNAIAFNILADGIPIIYAGQEQHLNGGNTPYEREATWLSGYDTGATLYTFIASLNKIRNQAIYKDSTYLTYKASPVYSDASTIVMRKGNAGYQIVGVFSNLGSAGSSYTLTLTSSETGFVANEAVIEVIGCTLYTTDSSGSLGVSMSGGLPRAFYSKAQLAGSGICGSITESSSSVYSTSSTSSRASSATSTTTSPTSKPTSTTSSACPPSASAPVAITFNVLKTTTYGQTIKLVGNTTALGNWAPASAIALSASAYTSSNPVWSGTISLPAGQIIQYKYIDVSSGGAVTWEADPNHTYTVPAVTGYATGAAAVVSNTWQT